MNLFAGLENVLTENVPLAPLTWFNVGGPARYFFKPTNEDQLKTILLRCRDNNLPWRILGQGANLLIDDSGINAAVIKLDPQGFGSIDFANDNSATLGAAAILNNVVFESVRRGLTGPEALVGIPGTIGGAVKMNAGGRYGDIGTLVGTVTIVDAAGETYTLEREELDFDYRSSSIQDQIVTQTKLQLISEDPERTLAKMQEVWIIKKASQPLSSRSAGCVFKNPSPDVSAGALIDKAGLKGKSVGAATVSDQHANFIITQPGATAKDIMSLIELIQTQVQKQFHVELELEIDVWNDRSA